MKCPTCDFVCSTEKDICPKCRVDLRRYKRKLGLPVTNPKIQYRRLLAMEQGVDLPPAKKGRNSKEQPEQEPSSQERTGVTGALSSLFWGGAKEPLDDDLPPFSHQTTRKEPLLGRQIPGKFVDLPPEELQAMADRFDEEAAEAKRRGDPHLVVLPGDESPDPSPPPDPARSTSVTETPHRFPSPPQGGSTPLLREARSDPPVEERARPRPSSPIPSPRVGRSGPPREPTLDELLALRASGALASSSHTEMLLSLTNPTAPPPPKPTEPDEFEISFEIEEEEVAPPPADRSSPVYQLNVPAAKDRGILLTPTPALDIEAVARASRRLVTEKPATSPAPLMASAVSTPHPDLSALFQEAYLELGRTAPSKLEFSFGDLAPRERTEELELLFSMADDSFADPTSLKRYTDNIARSETRKVENETLQRDFEQFEKQFSAPLMSLKGRGGSSGASEPLVDVDLVPSLEVIDAPRSWMVLSGVVDSCFATLLTASVVTAAHAARVPPFKAHLSALQRPELMDLLYVTTTVTALLPAALLLYQMIGFLLMRTTFGLAYTGLEFVDRKGYPASRSRLFIRATIQPVALLLGGPMLCLLGNRSLADRVAGTRTVVAPPEVTS